MSQDTIDALPSRSQKAAIIKKDLIVAFVAGLLVALLALPMIKIVKPELFKLAYLVALVVFLPILSAIGMLAALILAQKIKVIYQLAKFILVGVLNTAIDWGVLNIFLALMAVTDGPLYPVGKGISFVFASFNSYLWNKYWTFNKPAWLRGEKEEKEKNASKEVSYFFIVSLVGFALNVAVASAVVNVWGPHFGISKEVWPTIGALCGTFVGLAWNFLGYKLIVFKR